MVARRRTALEELQIIRFCVFQSSQSSAAESSAQQKLFPKFTIGGDAGLHQLALRLIVVLDRRHPFILILMDASAHHERLRIVLQEYRFQQCLCLRYPREHRQNSRLLNALRHRNIPRYRTRDGLFESADLMQSTISAHELLEPADLRAYDLLADAQVVYLVDRSSQHEHLLFGVDFIASTFRGPKNRVRFLRIECNRGTREEDLTRLWVSTVKGINPGRYA